MFRLLYFGLKYKEKQKMEICVRNIRSLHEKNIDIRYGSLYPFFDKSLCGICRGTDGGQTEAGTELSIQAIAVTEDIHRVVDVLKTGRMDEGSAGSASFQQLGEGTFSMSRSIMETAQAQAGARSSSYTQDDLYILAHVICGEAQSYPDEEQLYVGSVVLNRVDHPSFPDSVSGVVFQRGQYACTWDGNYYREPTPQNWANARYLLEHGSVLPGNVVWQSGGRQGSGVYIRTRYHCYCY